MNNYERMGKIARMMITNHHNNRLTNKSDLCTALSITRRELEPLLGKVVKFLKNFGLEMEGTQKLESGQMDRFFLRLASNEDEEIKKVKPEVTEDEKRLFFVFAVIQIENNKLNGAKEDEIRKCRYFDGVELGEYMKRLKSLGYITFKKVEDDIVWSYGWRFYVEYGDSFDISDYFRSIGGTSYE